MATKIEKIEILLVCDAEEEINGLLEALREIDFDYSINVISTHEVHSMLINKQASVPPRLIITCLTTGDEDQLSLLDRIRNYKTYDKTTLIIISKSTDPDIVNRTLSSGGNIFISKPRTKQALAEVLLKVFKSHFSYAEHGFDRSAYYLKL